MAELDLPPPSDESVAAEAEAALAAVSAGADLSGEIETAPSPTTVSPVAPETPPRTKPHRFERRRSAAKPMPLWRRCLPALAGLVLLLVCLFELIRSEPWPHWKWPQVKSFRAAGPVKVVIDPGHGGGDSGAVAQGVVEKSLNLDVGLRVAENLRRRGISVTLTRTDDRFISLEQRVRIANALPGAIFVSLHCNDAPNVARRVPSRASGIETFYSETRDVSSPPRTDWMWASMLNKTAAPDAAQQREAVRRSQLLADSIQGSMVTGTSAADRGIKERALYVTRRVHGPAVLVESGFVSHPSEARRLGDPAYRQQLADSIAAGIVKYLDAARRDPDSLPPALARLRT